MSSKGTVIGFSNQIQKLILLGVLLGQSLARKTEEEFLAGRQKTYDQMVTWRRNRSIHERQVMKAQRQKDEQVRVESTRVLSLFSLIDYGFVEIYMNLTKRYFRKVEKANRCAI